MKSQCNAHSYTGCPTLSGFKRALQGAHSGLDAWTKCEPLCQFCSVRRRSSWSVPAEIAGIKSVSDQKSGFMPILKGLYEKRLVLPDRIELSTSPLPMECSTTELRQHAPDTRIGQKAPTRRADPCHKARRRASARTVCAAIKSGYDQPGAAADAFNWLSCGPIRFPISSPSAASALIGRTMTSNSIISPVSPNLMRSTPLSCHLPILAENSSAASWVPAIKVR